MGTSSEGILKFNKISWVAYNSSNSDLPSNRITALNQEGGKVFIGYDESLSVPGGIIVFDGNEWNSNLFAFEAQRVNEIYIDDEHNKWISTDEGIYFLSNSNVPRVYNAQNSGLKSNSILSIYRHENFVWVATESDGIYKLKL